MGTLISLYAQAFDSNGNAVGSALNIVNTGIDRSFTRTLAPEQRYYVRVWAYYKGGYGTYQIAFNTSVVPPGASSMVSNIWSDGSSGAYGQQWFTFTANSATQYFYLQLILASSSEVYVQIYDDSNTAVGAEAVFSSSSGGSNFSRTLTAGNTYHVRVRSRYSSVYKITFNEAFSPPGAAALSANTWTNGSVSVYGEQWFSFTAAAAKQWIHINPPNYDYFWTVQVFDSSGGTVGGGLYIENYSHADKSYSPVLISGALYFVRVAASNAAGAFTIALSASVVPPGTIPTPMTQNNWVTGSGTTFGQQWFSFTATAATQYIHYTYDSLMSRSAYMQVYDSSGNAVGADFLHNLGREMPVRL